MRVGNWRGNHSASGYKADTNQRARGIPIIQGWTEKNVRGGGGLNRAIFQPPCPRLLAGVLWAGCGKHPF